MYQHTESTIGLITPRPAREIHDQRQGWGTYEMGNGEFLCDNNEPRKFPCIEHEASAPLPGLARNYDATES